MNIRIEKIETLKDDHLRIITSWYNDSQIKYFLTPNFKETDLKENTIDEVKLWLLNNRSEKERYLVFDNQILIGEFSIDFNFFNLFIKGEKSAWISLCIGNKEYWHKGIGKIIISELEKIVKDKGVNRIELGVFEFNSKAKVLYEKMGYKQIGINKNLTYFNGKWYDDIRMEKLI